MLCSPPPATTLASSCAGSEGFCAPCCRRSSQRSRIHNRPKTGRTLLLHERLPSEGPWASSDPGPSEAARMLARWSPKSEAKHVLTTVDQIDRLIRQTTKKVPARALAWV